ncbi:uncharacterized protein LOC110646419 [Hevea brasiliensis]|uniref:uncharacterized protein LOC110646419 n=1 Tax=Hevea brasiliensis TaxID=3981 RepID=UPI0025E31B50|nr:uncharacterized protein LOC110646419 [Hevea brasiliensis]
MRKSQLKLLRSEDQIAEDLQFMDLSHYMNLIKTPELSKFPKLEVLHLKDCTSLVGISTSLKLLKIGESSRQHWRVEISSVS